MRCVAPVLAVVVANLLRHPARLGPLESWLPMHTARLVIILTTMTRNLDECSDVQECHCKTVELPSHHLLHIVRHGQGGGRGAREASVAGNP